MLAGYKCWHSSCNILRKTSPQTSSLILVPPLVVLTSAAGHSITGLDAGVSGCQWRRASLHLHPRRSRGTPRLARVSAAIRFTSSSREAADLVSRSTSYYMQSFSPLQIVLRPTKAATPGDVLREVDSLQILAPADFLVVQAGYVGSIDLAQKVKDFTERRTADPTMTMSCVVAAVEPRWARRHVF